MVGAVCPHHRNVVPLFHRLFHRVLESQCRRDTQVGQRAEIEHDALTVGDRVVLPGDRLGHDEDYGAVELEEQHLAFALIQQHLLLRGEIKFAVA